MICLECCTYYMVSVCITGMGMYLSSNMQPPNPLLQLSWLCLGPCLGCDCYLNIVGLIPFFHCRVNFSCFFLRFSQLSLSQNGYNFRSWILNLYPQIFENFQVHPPRFDRSPPPILFIKCSMSQ